MPLAYILELSSTPDKTGVLLVGKLATQAIDCQPEWYCTPFEGSGSESGDVTRPNIVTGYPNGGYGGPFAQLRLVCLLALSWINQIGL